MFNIDFTKLIGWLLPPLLRRCVYSAWMNALCAPVLVLYGTPTSKTAGTFMGQRYLDLYQVNHDSRVFSMQAVLNDSFDTVSRRIVITDGLNKDGLFVYKRLELSPLYLNMRGVSPPVYLFNRGDYGDTGFDFIVWVPTAITLSATQLVLLKGLVNLYKLASKRYTVYIGTPS